MKYVEDLRFDLLQVLWKSMIYSKVYMFAIINLPSHSRNNHFFFPRYMAFQICEANDSLIYIYIYIYSSVSKSCGNNSQSTCLFRFRYINYPMKWYGMPYVGPNLPTKTSSLIYLYFGKFSGEGVLFASRR